jgi:hypothetical protein
MRLSGSGFSKTTTLRRALKENPEGAQQQLSTVVHLGGQFFKPSYVALGNDSRAFEAIVIPTSPAANLETLVATFDTMPGVALAVVSALCYVQLDAGEK